MKKLLLVPLALLALLGFSQVKYKKKVIQNDKKVKELPDSAVYALDQYKDNIDNNLKGPHGESVYIGPNGGRYYLTGTQKVYIANKSAKKKVP